METNQNGNIQQGQAGQPANTSHAPVAQPAPIATELPSGSQPQFVTKQEAEQMVKAATEQVARQVQSKMDSTSAAISKEVQRLAQAGITATPEQAKAIVEAREAESFQAPISGQPAAPQVPEVVADPVIRKSLKIMGEVGLTNDQEEFKLIDQETDDPEVFLESVRKASKAFAERNANLSNPARVPSLSSGSSSSTPSHAGKSATATLDDYYSNLNL